MQAVCAAVRVPAVGQGAIGMQIRENDQSTISALNKINDIETFFCVSIERTFLHALEGGCQIPIGCQVYFSNNNLVIEGVVASQDGTKYLNEKVNYPFTKENIMKMEKNIQLNKALEIGGNMAQIFINKGALDIIRGVRN